MNYQSSKRGEPSNTPAGGEVFTSMLEAMSISELTEALDHTLEKVTEENYDPALIDAYLDALDRKAPMTEAVDAKISYARFQKKLRCFAPESHSVVCRFRGAWRTALTACLAIICLLGLMVVAQAAGMDIFGTMAQWTDEVFSLGAVRSSSLGYVLPKEPAEYNTFQEALDAYQVTEFFAPGWVPDGYTLESVEVEYWDEFPMLSLYVEYTDGDDILAITIASYSDEPNMQIEKTEGPVEVIEVDGTTVYLLENTNNRTAAWATEHFECVISCALEKPELVRTARSTFAADN